MNAIYEEFKSRIRRVYRVLGKIYGEIQNEQDIADLESQGEINHEEAMELRNYNAEFKKQRSC